MRFKIRNLMLVIAAVAALLASLRFPTVFLAILLTSFVGSWLAWCLGLWRAATPYRRLSAVAFAIAATFTNVFCVVASITMPGAGMAVIMIILLACVFGIPSIFGFGAAWCTAATRKSAVPRRSRALVWPMVLALSLAPVTVLLTQWPFRLAFLASRPSLARLADQVAAGVPVTKPRWAGAFVIVGSAFDPKTGNVGLITNPDRSGRSGFERYGPRGTRGGPGAFYNFWSETEMDQNWRYAEED